VKRLASRWIGLPILAVWLVWPQLLAAETIDFKVTYHGMFTAYQEFDIGDVRLDITQTRSLLDDEPIVRAQLTASSAAYPLVEQFYPYRYDFTSYHQGSWPRSLAFERRKQTSRLRHDLLLLNWEGAALWRFGIDDAEQSEPLSSQLPAAMFKTLLVAGLPDYGVQLKPRPEGQAPPPESTLDRLALLQQIRALPLLPDTSEDLTVTDGKEFIHYRVTVIKRELIQAAAGSRSAWKIRVEGFESDHGEERFRHRPVYIWISDDQRRLPLRFVIRHAVGTFTVEMQPGSAIQSVANAISVNEVKRH